MIKIIQIFEQFKIIKKILLNEHQCYMLDHKGKHTIYNKKISSETDFTKVIEEKKNGREVNWVSYRKEGEEQN